jgi:predicted DNA-binding transcriptional regulator YafY
MHRFDRLTAILIQLQTKRVVTAQEMAARYGVSLRTVYRDIRTLEEAGVPIGAEAGRGYFLADGYRLPPVMFTPDEAGALLMGGKLIAQFSDADITRHFSGALDKIKAVLNRTDQDYLDRLDALVSVRRAAPTSMAALPDNMLLELQAHLAHDRVITVEYLSGYKEELTRRTLEPLGLCFYAGHWHLLAFCHLRSDYRDFRADRLRTIADTGDRFDRRRHGDFSELIRKIVMPTELKPARLIFTPAAAKSIREQKFYFGFVREEPAATGVAMEFLVPDYDYLSRWLLSLVDQVTVSAPDALKCIMDTHLRRLRKHYG